MLPDRADTVAVIETAVQKAVEYWGTEFDVEHTAYNDLILADVKITRQEFAELVEARIAVAWADQHADLSRYDLEDSCDWFTRAEFIRQQREEWIAPITNRVVRRTRDARQFETADTLNDLQAAA